MKKNKMMRLASAMMVLTLMSTSVISGTFAKYVTSDSASDSARVAKFGVTVTATDNTMFSYSYVGKAVAENTVVAGGGVNDLVVAPGTSGTEVDLFTIEGTPEVAVKIEVDINTEKDIFLAKGKYADMTTGDATDTFSFDAEDYHPVVFTLTKNGTEIASGTLEAIMNTLDVIDKDFVAPGTNLANEYGTYKLKWTWAFPDSDSVITDQKDTLLGDLAANSSLEAKGEGPTFTALTENVDFSTKLNFDVTVKVTQID